MKKKIIELLPFANMDIENLISQKSLGIRDASYPKS